MHVHRQSILASSLKEDQNITKLFEQAFIQEEIEALRQVEDCYYTLQAQTFPETYFVSEEQEAESLMKEVDCTNILEQSPYRDHAVSDLKASLAIAAYERTLLATDAPFQQWLRELNSKGSEEASYTMTLDELRGARIFFDSNGGNCASCHTGPSLSDGGFHIMGLADLLESDRNRIHTKLFEGEEQGRGGWTGRDDLKYAFKTPQLYNLTQKSFYGHGSTHRTLESMVRYMVRGKKMVGFIGGDRPLDAAFTKRQLSESQILDLLAFLKTGLFDTSLLDELPEVLERTCIISADRISSHEQNCTP
jgi:cytochrome c peroxidase